MTTIVEHTSVKSSDVWCSIAAVAVEIRTSNACRRLELSALEPMLDSLDRTMTLLIV